MQKLHKLSIENFRSIGESPIEIEFRRDVPLILIGENNAGKSNIIRAIELMFGEYHPAFKKLEDYDHFNRDKNTPVHIKATVVGFQGRLGMHGEHKCTGFNFQSSKGQSSLEAVQEDGNVNKYVKGELREELACTVVGADTNLSYQMSYASKWTLLSKVTRAFHERLIEDPERVASLKGFFNDITETFNGVPEFKAFRANMTGIAGEMMSSMSHALQFDFSAYDPSNYFKTLRVHPTDGTEIRTFDELGTGQQQMLALAFAHAYAKSFKNQGLIFILDEPEAHLHPNAQRWLAKQMYQMATDGLQLVVSTHSPFFIDMDFLDGLYIVTKSDQTSVSNTNKEKLAAYCRETGAPKATGDKILPFYAAHSKPEILSGLFAKKVVLVEGETEELALPFYLSMVGLECLKEGISIIGVGGKGNLAKWWRLFTHYGIPTYVCFDNDADDDAGAVKRKDALKAIGIVHADIEEAINTRDWNLKPKFCVFGRDFETTFKSSFAKYEALETEAQQVFGGSKPVVAKEVAKSVCKGDKAEGDIGWQKLKDLADAIQKLES